MRKMLIAVALLGVGACVSSRPSSSSSSSARPVDALTVGGATTPRGAVEGFLAAVKKQDLQAMSQYWGTEKGLARDHMSREKLEKSLVIIQCSTNHDSWQYAADGTAIVSLKEQLFGVELRQRGLRAKTVMTTVQGPENRWFVEDINLVPLGAFCR
jgi:hypothetical protein